MYNKIETDDEGDVSMKKVVEHINAVEAGRGNNSWVRWRIFNHFDSFFSIQVIQRLGDLMQLERKVAHVELEEFLVISHVMMIFFLIFVCSRSSLGTFKRLAGA